MLTRMQQRRGTAAEWSDSVISSTVILNPGEIGLETDTGRFKIGNGATVWANLPYYLPDNNPTSATARIGKNNHDLYVKLAPLAPGYNQTITGINVLVPQANTQTPLTVAGISGQTALLQSWRSSLSVSTPVASISSAGKLTAAGASFTDDVQMNNKVISGLKDIDSSATDNYAVNKKYVDEAIAGLAWKSPVNLVSASALNTWVDVPLTGNTGTIILDGHSALTQAHGDGYRLLLVNQTTAENNGIWEYSDNGTTYTLARPTDADTPEELRGASVFIEEGTVYGTSSWVQTNHYLSSFGGSQQWVQFNGASQITAGDGLTKNGNVINAVGTADRITANADSIDIASTYVGQTSITTLGTIATGTWTADTIAADQGGTGQTSYTVGDILYASSTSALSKLPAGTIHYPLVSGGTGTDPLYAQIVTAGIADSSSTTTGVTYAKIQYVSGANKILGRITSGSGTVEELNGDDVITIVNTASSGKIDTTRLNTATGGNYGSSTDVARKDHTHNIDDLADVIITGTPQTRQVIKFNGTSWINELPSGGISTGPTPPDLPSNGDAWFDTTDGSLYVRYDDGVADVRTNLLPNSSFEDAGISFWTGGENTETASTEQALFGTKSLKVAYTSNPILATGFFSINPNEDYTLSAYVYVPVVADNAYLSLIFYDASSNFISIQQGSLVLGDSTWERISKTATAPSNATQARIQLEVSGTTGAGSYYVDGFMLEQSATLNDFIVGTSSSGSSAQWVQVKANSALEASILTRMSAVEARDTKLEAANAVRVANATERNSVYPAPVQGNTVFRADLGYEEKYYAAYNATTNPDGTTGTIGWYRYAGGAPLSENYIINGGLDIWQRGTASTATGVSATTGFLADRWQCYRAAYGAGATMQQITDAPAGFKFGLRLQRTAGNTSTSSMQHGYSLESANTLRLQGKPVTLSFYARAGSNYSSSGNAFQAIIYSGTGTDQNMSNGLTGSTNIGGSTVALTTSWQRFTATGVVPSNSTQLGINMIWIPTGTAGVNDYVDITGVQLEEGPVATPFRRNQPNIQAELAACQRYYVPSTLSFSTMSGLGSSTRRTAQFFYPVPMRATPILTISGGELSSGLDSNRLGNNDNKQCVYEYQCASTGNYGFSYVTASAEL